MKTYLRAVAAALVATAALSGLAPMANAAPTKAPVEHAPAAAIQLTAQEQAQWERLVSTEEGRQRVVTELQEAFAGVAGVGVAAPEPAKDGEIRTELATGITGDHFWIIASYADIVNGAVWAGVRACQLRLPGWLCTAAGNLLVEWAKGWGSANDHGVWAEVYWLPPRIAAGRW
ncbi:hypothetical protein [Nocardia sp. NRRL S-836]|uniref:hypothetical protein n=1 Tax=Nocardia sp. NRRL S-836 TaxID=1519492 RepID=UPI0006AF603E|nr:hypothetical protein [Nocardia sp. NRRL S-836]KOV84619.1 hypothetical protein ADL03_15080 [Nocardia sp. NRRL S-836]